MIECCRPQKLNSYSACAHSAIKKVQELAVQGLCAMVSYYPSVWGLTFDLYMLTTAYYSSKIVFLPAELQLSAFSIPNKERNT